MLYYLSFTYTYSYAATPDNSIIRLYEKENTDSR